jgi:hypothetical protein
MKRGTSANARFVRIELCEDDEIAIGRENAPRGRDRVSTAYNFQAAF